MITEWLNQYQPRSREEMSRAMREIMQEIALAGLYRAGFFEKAAFYGGTALRIFYQLPRFSEDLDFSLLKPDEHFAIEDSLKSVAHEFEALGMKVSFHKKVKSKKTAIDSAFLKSETSWNELILERINLPELKDEKINIKIKLEVDTRPPMKFETEEKLLLKPFSCYIRCFSASDLFAGKVHALLFRKWKSRVKGRDWFDFEWYIKQGFTLNAGHLQERAVQSGDWRPEKKMTGSDVRKLLVAKIKDVSFPQIKDEAGRFVTQPRALEIWSARYFLELLQRIKIAE